MFFANSKSGGELRVEWAPPRDAEDAKVRGSADGVLAMNVGTYFFGVKIVNAVTCDGKVDILREGEKRSGSDFKNRSNVDWG